MPVFGAKPTDEERREIPKFFDKACYFYWDGTGSCPSLTLDAYRQVTVPKSGAKVCTICNIAECPVRQAKFRSAGNL